MNLRSFLSFFIVLIPLCSFCQSITPQTLNNGGGSIPTMDWSISESVSITLFIAPGYSLNTGVLQPNTDLVTSISEYGPAVFGSQIIIGPNPTASVLHIKTRFPDLGKMSLQLIDTKSSIMLTQEIGMILNSYEKDISMQDYPSGVYYMKIFFKPIIGSLKTGIYKIIKL